ncbi:hypothetical protein [Chitinophaga sp. CB10]|uniref:hypothetical protein n=1 Tax=Chitinophaga sp. CB10 TaxID=1891659 RepID=UPI0025B7ACED|nr:hypothetical protein [Chitinophaga sp. CB10]
MYQKSKKGSAFQRGFFCGFTDRSGIFSEQEPVLYGKPLRTYFSLCPFASKKNTPLESGVFVRKSEYVSKVPMAIGRKSIKKSAACTAADWYCYLV